MIVAGQGRIRMLVAEDDDEVRNINVNVTQEESERVKDVGYEFWNKPWRNNDPPMLTVDDIVSSWLSLIVCSCLTS